MPVEFSKFHRTIRSFTAGRERQHNEHGRNHPESPVDGAAISLIDLGLMLIERKSLILWLTGSLAAVSLLVCMFLPRTYTAEAVIVPPRPGAAERALLFSGVGRPGSFMLPQITFGHTKPNNRYIAMMESRTVEDAIVRRFDLRQVYKARYTSDARQILEHHTDLDGDSKGGVIHISVRDSDARRAAAIATGYVEEFRNLSRNIAATEASQRAEYLNEQIKDARLRLDNAELALKETEQSSGAFQINDQTRSLIGASAILRAQIESKQVQINAIRTYATENNSELIQARQELSSLRDQLARLDTFQNAKKPLHGAGLTAQQIPSAAIEYSDRLRDVRFYGYLLDLLRFQLKQAQVDEARRGPSFQVLDSAIPPKEYSSPKYSESVIETAIVGMLSGISLSFLLAGWEALTSHGEARGKLKTLKIYLSLRYQQCPQRRAS